MKKTLTFHVDRSSGYIGDEEDGCYYKTVRKSDGYYVTVIVDCDSAGFVEDLVTDDGPYTDREDAGIAGRSASIEWCMNNNVSWEER